MVPPGLLFAKGLQTFAHRGQAILSQGRSRLAMPPGRFRKQNNTVKPRFRRWYWGQGEWYCHPLKKIRAGQPNASHNSLPQAGWMPNLIVGTDLPDESPHFQARRLQPHPGKFHLKHNGNDILIEQAEPWDWSNFPKQPVEWCPRHASSLCWQDTLDERKGTHSISAKMWQFWNRWRRGCRRLRYPELNNQVLQALPDVPEGIISGYMLAIHGRADIGRR